MLVWQSMCTLSPRAIPGILHGFKKDKVHHSATVFCGKKTTTFWHLILLIDMSH